MFILISVLLLLFVNVAYNIFALRKYDNDNFNNKIMQDPNIISLSWHWLEYIVRMGLIPYLIRITLCVIIAITLMLLTFLIPTVCAEQKFLLYCIALFIASMICTRGAYWVWEMSRYAQRKKRKMTSDNNENA